MVSRTWLSCDCDVVDKLFVGNCCCISWSFQVCPTGTLRLSQFKHGSVQFWFLVCDKYSYPTLTANIIYPPLCHWLILLSKIFVTTKRFYEGLNDKYLSHEIGNKKSYTNHSIIIQLNKFWEEIFLKMTNKLNKNLWLHWFVEIFIYFMY